MTAGGSATRGDIGGMGGGAAGQAGARGATPDFSALDAYFDGVLAKGLIHGVAMQVFDSADQPVYTRESGVCASTPACPPGQPAFKIDLVTGIASSSKWVTSSTVLAALEDHVAAGGADSLDAALDTAVAPLLDCPGVTGPVTKITFRHLLAFTSGVIPEAACIDDRNVSVNDCACQVLTNTANAMVTTSPPPATSAKTAGHPPGTTYKYGDAHHIVAEAAVEALTGRTYGSIFDEKIRKPLDVKMFYRNIKNLAGSLQSSVADYARFVGAVFHDGQVGGPHRILSAEAVAAQRDDQTPADVVILISPQKDCDYGLNTWRWCYDNFDASAAADFTKLVTRRQCDQVFQSGHGGKGGYQPFLDVAGRYYAVMAVREDSAGGGAAYTREELAITLTARLLTHVAMMTGMK